MNKIMVGILVGAVLGAIDGGTAWFTPAVRPMIIGIMVGSTIKGMIAGIAAGWFARKVQSIPAGIAFGLAVGALLAFIVCQLQGGKYYFEIMLPGSIVGLIVGWATQRYGRPAKSLASAHVVALALILVAASARADITAAEAFSKLKSLAGTWNAHLMKADGPATSVEYRVTSGGSALMERLFADTGHEMVTMYTVDGNELVATHYCAAGNQPSLKLNRAASNADKLVFDFVSLRGGDPAHTAHMHNGWIAINGDTAEALWAGYGADGKPAEPPHRFFLSRAK